MISTAPHITPRHARPVAKTVPTVAAASKPTCRHVLPQRHTFATGDYRQISIVVRKLQSTSLCVLARGSHVNGRPACDDRLLDCRLAVQSNSCSSHAGRSFTRDPRAPPNLYGMGLLTSAPIRAAYMLCCASPPIDMDEPMLL